MRGFGGQDVSKHAKYLRFLPLAIALAFAILTVSAPNAGNAQEAVGNPSSNGSGYAEAGSCAICHQEIAATYAQTGMGRSFYPARPENMVEDFAAGNPYYHLRSNRYYTMIERDGQYFQRRHQLDLEGREINVFERQIHYVMGSGNHTRAYLHLDPQGRLTQLPLGWYPERGGYWAMNPNYDQPKHSGFQRDISFECMFCHNGYPEVAPGEDVLGRPARYRGRLAEGIDCQRCHGPGQNHIDAVSAGAGAEKVRAAILNPADLDPERQLETCMQCHLETTSRSLPHSIQRFDRPIFSFRPGEPLADYILHFDKAPTNVPEDRFEVAHMAYRMRKSACFLATAGTPQAMTCTTCHDPHHVTRGDEATAQYVSVCRDCHGADFNALVAAGQHTESADCLGCHMPKRRADDVIHAVMTDHYIQRHKPNRDLLAPLSERMENDDTRYRGEVVLYYPPELPATPDTELYLAVAQVMDGSNLEAGIPRLRQAIDTHQPAEADFYFHMAEAYGRVGKLDEAFPMYEAALERGPKHRDAWLNYSVALSEAGQAERAVSVLKQALEQLPDDPKLLNNLGDAYTKQGLPSEALSVLQQAVAIDPALPTTQNNLGLAHSAMGNAEPAMAAWREAIRIQPDYALAHNNLANALSNGEQFAEAESHYRQAIELDPEYVEAHFNYAALLASQGRNRQAETELEQVIRLEPGFAPAYRDLGNLLGRRGYVLGAIEQYRLALQIDSSLDEVHLSLGMALGSRGDFLAARRHFEQAAKSTDPALSRAAQDVLKEIQALEAR